MAATAIVSLITGGLIAWVLLSRRGIQTPAMSPDAVRSLATDALRANNEMFLSQAKVALEAVLTDAKGAVDKQRESLRTNNELFLAQAQSTLDKALTEAKGAAEKNQQSVVEAIKPLQEALQRYEQQVKSVEERRLQVEGGLRQQLEDLGRANQQLQKETANLVNALRTPHVRGRWGELTLRRVAELAGMVEHCDFQEQVSITGENGRLRPDMVVHLPNGRQIVVDAKVSLDAYLQATEAASEEQRSLCLKRHTEQVRTHLNGLASKPYIEQFKSSADLVVMFIPGEPFLAAAVQHHPGLIEEAIEKRVVVATPGTLVALLKTVAYGWQQEQLAQNARLIGETARELYTRSDILISQVVKIGKGIEDTLKAYNGAVGSLESRWLPKAREINRLLGANDEGIPPLEPILQTTRAIKAPETVFSPGLDALSLDTPR
jgi:DNA recombination protein RmuC